MHAPFLVNSAFVPSNKFLIDKIITFDYDNERISITDYGTYGAFPVFGIILIVVAVLALIGGIVAFIVIRNRKLK